MWRSDCLYGCNCFNFDILRIMTQEDKELLLKDLCARLPYFVQVNINGEIQTLNSWADDDGNYFNFLSDESDGNYGEGFTLDEIKPYLRPMSSMTKEEKDEASKLGICYDGAFHNDIYDVGIGMEEAFAAISWLLKRHFDINYLIQKGLALEAPEGMYTIN